VYAPTCYSMVHCCAFYSMKVGLEASIGKMIGDTFVDRGLLYLIPWYF